VELNAQRQDIRQIVGQFSCDPIAGLRVGYQVLVGGQGELVYAMVGISVVQLLQTLTRQV